MSSSGIISTVAGNGTYGLSGDGGAATDATLKNPLGLAVDGDVLYIADSGNDRIRTVQLTTGIISTLAVIGCNIYGCSPFNLYFPIGMAVDPDGNLLIASGDSVILVVAASTGVVSIAAGIFGEVGYNGDGMSATTSKLSQPYGVAIGPSNTLLIADTSNHRIRKLTPCPGGCSHTPSLSHSSTRSATGSATSTRTQTRSSSCTRTSSHSRPATHTVTKSVVPSTVSSRTPVATRTQSATRTHTTVQTKSRTRSR